MDSYHGFKAVKECGLKCQNKVVLTLFDSGWWSWMVIMDLRLFRNMSEVY
jgi:hypothetical protein